MCCSFFGTRYRYRFECWPWKIFEWECVFQERNRTRTAEGFWMVWIAGWLDRGWEFPSRHRRTTGGFPQFRPGRPVAHNSLLSFHEKWTILKVNVEIFLSLPYFRPFDENDICQRTGFADVSRLSIISKDYQFDLIFKDSIFYKSSIL